MKFTVDGSIASIKIPSSIPVDNSEAFLSCGLAGLGVLHGLRPSLAPFIASGELTEILTDFPPPPKPVSLLYPDRRYLAPKVRVFIDWLCEVFGPMHISDNALSCIPDLKIVTLSVILF